MADESCYNCTSYQNGTCGMPKKICSEYKYAPEPEDWWPKSMVGAYGSPAYMYFGRTTERKIKTRIHNSTKIRDDYGKENCCKFYNSEFFESDLFHYRMDGRNEIKEYKAIYLYIT